MLVTALWPAALAAIVTFAAAKPTRTSRPTFKRQSDSNVQFVSTSDGQFTVNGSPIKFVGTNAYWLHTLNTEQDIDHTLESIAKSGVKVVRTWAFNDVTSVPETGTYFALINNNGTVEVNNGPNGLQKLDMVVDLAEKHGLFVLLALTNNWSPDPIHDDIEVGAGPSRRSDLVWRANEEPRPRNFLSNDYGGMDTYVRQFGLKNHDEFYTNPKVKSAFKYYTKCVVERYAKSPAILGWELANDPRCNSTLPATTCNPKVITKWHSELAQHVKQHDPNHLVSSGNGGHFCVDCPKLFPRDPVTPPPQVSPVPGATRRAESGFLTKARLVAERATNRKRNRLSKRKPQSEKNGVKVRGRWTSTATVKRQQDQELGSAFDGSYGVDSEDIMNIPQLSFGSFQLFPDQDTYGPDDSSLSKFENMVQRGNEWIRRHAETARALGKPTTLSGFGLVTQQNLPKFVPFNSSEAPYASDTDPAPVEGEQPHAWTTDERDRAFSSWLTQGLESGLESMIHYQWGQGNLTVQPGTTVHVAVNSTGIGIAANQTGTSPNDGYSTNGIDADDSVVDFLEEASQAFAPDSELRRRR